MTNDIRALSTTSNNPLETISDAIAQTGWAVLKNAIPRTLAKGLHQAATEVVDYKTARVGRNKARHENRFVRRDVTSWITGNEPAEAAWLRWTNQLRRHLNQSLFLGLERFESHFALYNHGTFYRRHLDTFRGTENRKLSLVLYLNPLWLPSHGGELVIFDHDNRTLVSVAPEIATLVVFLSEYHPHEVLPTYADRYSIAGWFSTRAKLPLENLSSSNSDIRNMNSYLETQP